MDISYIEFAAQKFFEMCREHPEICPHDYTWEWTSAPDDNEKRTEHYKCTLCGKEYTRIK